MMAFDNAGSDSAPIGTFNLKDMGQGIDCRNDGSKVSAPINLVLFFFRGINFQLTCTECRDSHG